MPPFKSYSEKLKSPQWQKKRLEILDRDKFTCKQCSSKDKELHVHHKQYLRGKQPWDYENHYYKTLCSDCHKEEQDLKDRWDSMGAFMDTKTKAKLLNLISKREDDDIPDWVIIESLMFVLRSKEAVIFYWHLDQQLPHLNSDGEDVEK